MAHPETKQHLANLKVQRVQI